MRRRASAALAALLALPLSAFGYDINGVALGGGEAEVQKAFPSARCKPLEWKSDAADRRCDDARISLGGAEARITVFFKGGAIQAMDLRFNGKDLERVKDALRTRWGAPQLVTAQCHRHGGGDELGAWPARAGHR